MTTRNLEPDQWRNREEWRLVSGTRRQLLNKTGWTDRRLILRHLSFWERWRFLLCYFRLWDRLVW
jgi:hypothetical protein